MPVIFSSSVTKRNFIDMRCLDEETIGSMPNWAKIRLSLRNMLIATLKLQYDDLRDAMGKTRSVGAFLTLEETGDRIVLGLDDRHLNFPIIIDRSDVAQLFRPRATPFVNHDNIFRRICIATVTPFHRGIVQSVLKNAL